MEYPHNWAMYLKSTGGEYLTYWYQDDLDTFEYEGVTFTRVGPVVRAYTKERARELIMKERKTNDE